MKNKYLIIILMTVMVIYAITITALYLKDDKNLQDNQSSSITNTSDNQSSSVAPTKLNGVKMISISMPVTVDDNPDYNTIYIDDPSTVNTIINDLNGKTKKDVGDIGFENELYIKIYYSNYSSLVTIINDNEVCIFNDNQNTENCNVYQLNNDVKLESYITEVYNSLK